MTSLIKIHRKGQMTLPSRLRSAIGVVEGDLVEATLSRGKIVITPKLVIERAKFPNADDEYTPEQRRVIDARLDQSEKDFQAGRSYGPFATPDKAIQFLRKEIKARKSKPQSR